MANSESQTAASPSPPSLAPLEEALQRLGKGLRRAEAQRVHGGAIQRAIHLGKTVSINPGKLLAQTTATGVQFQEFTRFRVFNGQETSVGQCAFARIMEMEANQVVARIREAEVLNDVAAPHPN
jgi:hypothetical protein